MSTQQSTDPADGLDLDALERLCEAATPGPWKAKPMGGDSYVLAPDHKWHKTRLPYDDMVAIAIARRLSPGGGESPFTDPYSASFSHDDARFIAAARTALPRALATIRARDDTVANLEDDVQRLGSELAEREGDVVELQDAVASLQVNHNEASAALTLSLARVAELEELVTLKGATIVKFSDALHWIWAEASSLSEAQSAVHDALWGRQPADVEGK